jgi:hypothetical protein
LKEVAAGHRRRKKAVCLGAGSPSLVVAPGGLAWTGPER